MIFADLLFLFIFLPINLLLYFAFKSNAYRNAVLVVFSLIFYAWGEPLMIFLLLATTEINRVFALFIEKHKGEKRGKAFAFLSIGLTLTSLFVFKYTPLFNLPFRPNLPIGISFYSFQIITYIVGVYKGRFCAQRSRLNFLMYVSLYPQLTAGPIVRYEDIHTQINDRKMRLEDISGGITRFVIGLAKKILIANQIGAAATSILDGDVSSLSVGGAWLGIFFFALQIYYDFSGYSDMAIGLGGIFGFKFPENFNYPYISKSISEFWRRWHMTLGGFFRDYVYIPLGGNRRRGWLNLLIVWILTGLWHGASWNFALWGLYFGLIIIAERAFVLKIADYIPPALSFIRVIFTFAAVMFGWIMFYFTDFVQMLAFMRSLFGLNNNPLYDIITTNLLYNQLLLVIAAIIFCTPVYRFAEKRGAAFNYLAPVTNAALIILCAIMLVGDNYNPFLYYRF